jgi:mono/diheme cytochrome c family protein
MRILKIVLGVLGVGAVGIAGLVGYAAATAESKLAFPDAAAPDVSASTDPAVIERGRYLVHGPAHCAMCHSTDDRNRPELVRSTPLHGGLEFEMGPLGTRRAPNLTPHATGIGDLTDAQVARAIRSGVTHTGELSVFMRFSVGDVSDEDLVAILSYLRSVEPVDNQVPPGEWALFGKILLTYAFPPIGPRDTPVPTHVPPSDTPSLERGEYLADHVAMCTACHTQFDMSTFQSSGPKAGGGTPEPSHGEDTEMEFVAPNLTSHPTGITGRLDEDTFVQRMLGGRNFPSSIMPWECFADVTDADLRSIYRYLKSLPPIDNDVGPSYRKIGSHPPK